MLCLRGVPDEDNHPLENEESGKKLCENWSTIFQVRNGSKDHHCYETVLRSVQKEPDYTRWEIDRNEFDGLMATKKLTHPSPDGIPCSLYKCAGSLRSKFLNNA